MNVIGAMGLLTAILEEEQWQIGAPCGQSDPDAWFPDQGGSVIWAQKICNDCPVRERCLQYALDNDERWGLWGGVSERQRRKMKREQDQGRSA